MTKEQFDLAMKRFFRCMKENGYYWRVKRYILPPGRTRNDLLNDINDKGYNTTFSRLLLYLNLLGPSYDKFERIESGYWGSIYRLQILFGLMNVQINTLNTYIDYDTGRI